MRRITFLTAARSDYDIIHPVMLAARAAGCDVETVAGAAQMSPFHGRGIDAIRQDGFRIRAGIESLVASETWTGRALSFGHLMNGLAVSLSTDKPDILFVTGDREEALAGAMAGVFLKIPVAHLHGGDRCFASDVDEVFRPAISKLSHLHFVACADHKDRLVAMGEDAEKIWVSGAPGLDRLRDEPDLGEAALQEAFGIEPGQPFFLLIHHPSPTVDDANTGDEMEAVLDGALAAGTPVLCSYPNTDPGNIAMRRVIDRRVAREPRLKTYFNVPRTLFVTAYRRCAAVLGNSSSIVIESPFLKVPGILIGPRQDLRTIASNVVRVPVDCAAIRDACARALRDAEFRAQAREAESIYGDGRAAERIARVLAEVPLPHELLLKTMPY
jgi:GDP/UDP-N,N'-diacetylbacillosamine 2-epimerase (hydrolysing)